MTTQVNTTVTIWKLSNRNSGIKLLDAKKTWNIARYMDSADAISWINNQSNPSLYKII